MKNKRIPDGYLFNTRYTNYVFALLFMLYMFDYIDRMIITSIFPFLKTDWNLSDTECGLLVSIVYISISIFTFPISILIDRWSRKKTIGLMAVIWGISTAMGAFTNNFRQLFFVRTLIGLGEAGYAPGGSSLISALYPFKKRSWMMGIWNAAIPLGSAIGVAAGGIIASTLGWRHAFGLVAIPGILIAILFFFVRDYKTIELLKSKESNDQKQKIDKVKMTGKDMIIEITAKPSLILTYLGMACVVFTSTSIITWLPTYFHRIQGIDEGPAGVRAGIVMLLAIVGAPLGGFLADKWARKKANARLIIPTITCLISSVLLFLAFVIFNNEVQYITLLFAGISITAFIASAATVTQDVVHAGLRAISYAIAVIVQNTLGSTIAPVAIGAISDATNIETAFKLLPFTLLLGSILFFAASFYYVKDLSKVRNVQIIAELA